MSDTYLNSVNLNSGSDFPYLCMNIEKGKSIPEPPGFHIMHWHEDFQFILVLNGEICLHTLAQTMIIPAGCGVFLNRNVVHMVLASTDSHYKSFLFPEQLVSFYPGSPAAKYVGRIANCEQITCIKLSLDIKWQETILQRLKELAVLETTAPCYEYHVLVLLSALWLGLAKNVDVPKKRTTDETVKRMRIFLDYIEQHYAEDTSLDDLAQSAGVSKSECLRCFKLSLQDTPYNYLMEYRLRKASELLKNTNMPIGEISQTVGFHAQSHFGKLFKKKTGYSPKEYRAI